MANGGSPNGPVRPTYGQVAELERLRAAWHRVWRNNGSFGGDGQTVAEFAEKAPTELDRLRGELVEQRYRPRPLRGCRIPKADGSERRLLVPSVRDRVVQQSTLSVVGPWLELGFESSSWAFRPGRSHLGALAAFQAAWRAGYRWIAEGDVEDFYGSIDRPRLAGLLDAAIDDHRLVELILCWVGGRTGRGIPQGAPISPLLSNLYLDQFDEAMADPDRRFIRFADDFVVAARTADAAGRSLVAARRALGEMALRLKPSKTALRAPQESVVFLGCEARGGIVQPIRRWAARPERVAPHRRGDGWHVAFTEEERARYRTGSVAAPPTPGTPAHRPRPYRRGAEVPVSALRDLVVCPHAAWRRICLGEHPSTTAMNRGREEHRNFLSRAHGDTEVAVRSARLGLVGRLDVVERSRGEVVAVEVKSGAARPPSFADCVQLGAYALMLEEQGARADRLEIAFTDSRRREPVVLTPRLVDRVQLLARAAADLRDGRWVPTNRERMACTGCRFRSSCRQEP